MLRSAPLYVILTFCAVIIGAVFVFYVYESEDKISQVDSAQFGKVETCHPRQSSPIPALINVETHLGVNYDAGHWFHMAELIMTRHAELRAKNRLLNSTEIYYNFDKTGFTAGLNGITRFIVYLGTMAPHTPVKQMHFLSSRSLHDHVKHVNTPVNIMVDVSSISSLNQQSSTLGSSIEPSMRFAIVPFKPLDTKSASICMQYVGNLKNRWPTPQRGSWFPHEEDITDFRQKIRDACPMDNNLIRKVQKKKAYKLVIYQRNLSRKLAEEVEAVQHLRQVLSNDQWEISVLMHSSQRSPCELSHILHDVDVLLTPHGFQSMLLFFLPRPAVLFEVFPYRYWKRGYGPLSKEYGIIHSGVMSPATKWSAQFLLKFIKTSTCMQSKQCRGFARDQDVMLTKHGVNRLVQTIQMELIPALEKVKEKRDVLYKL